VLTRIFGERGKHTRLAVGVSELPLNACVELELVLEVE
jgi:enamine deaminase RidA (YjgF/YER057c/UK114 family)